MATPSGHCIIARLEVFSRDCVQYDVKAFLADGLQSRLELLCVLAKVPHNDLFRLKRREAIQDDLNL